MILVINLTKEAKDLHTGNYKTLLEEIKEDLNKLKHTLCSQSKSLGIAIRSILPTD